MAKKAKKVPLHSHAIASLSSVSPHVHTGKKLHRTHTSHGFLFLILILTGILLFSSLGMLKAYGVASQSGTNINVNVLGTPPSVGASIIFPATYTLTSHRLLQVSGTCPTQTLVSVYNNGTFAGSTVCTTADVFAVIIQLQEGINVLQAQNYDAMNQPGPVTLQYSITYEPEAVNPGQPEPTTPEVVVKTADQIRPIPVIPKTPPEAPQPSEQPCYELPNNKQVASSTTPVISVSCIHHNISVGDTLKVSVIIHSGVAPYALLTSWGDDSESELSSVSDSSSTHLSHVYQTSGIHEILLKTTDKDGATSQIQTVVNVNGDGIVAAPAKKENTFFKDLSLIWVEASVPLYISAITLVAGFWIGDIFERLHAKPGTRRHSH